MIITRNIKTSDDILKERARLWRSCEKSDLEKETVINLISRDPKYFFNYFLVTYDPRKKKDKVIPFSLYEYQERFIDTLQAHFLDREPLLVEKTRDMGFSWLILGFIVSKMITEKDFAAGIGSRKFELVDDLGDMNSMLQRVRFMLAKLPSWMKQGYNEKKDSKIGYVSFPTTGSILTGEGGDNIGRGGRSSMYVLDEFAHVPRSTMVSEAISQNSDFIVYGSTPSGKGNEFARLRWKTLIKRFSMHWKDHPLKDEAWYEKQKLTMTEEMIAQELDISYTKSTKGRVYKWFNSEKHAKESQKYNPNHPIFVTFDWGIGDPTACIFLQDYAGTIRIFDFFEIKDSEISIILNKTYATIQKHGATSAQISGWYGDPDGRNRNLVTGTSINSFMRDKYGIYLRFKLPNLIRPRIMSVMMLGEHDRILIDKDLLHFIECLENYRYPDKDIGENEKPVHDWTSHACSALEYYTSYEHGMDQNKKTEITAMKWR